MSYLCTRKPIDNTTMKKRQQDFRLYKEQIELTKVLNKAVASIHEHLKANGKPMWNFFSETNFGQDRLYGTAYVDGLNTLQEVVVCGLKTREVSGNIILDVVFAEVDKEPDEPLSDEELEGLFNCDNCKVTEKGFIRVNDLVYHFEGKMTLLYLILNLDGKYIKP